ncbi:MAG: hypothetical protein AB1411_02635 [Nitrospirota bacterium]
MRRVVLVISVIAGLAGCVSKTEYRALMDKYAHTLAIKNELDVEYGDLRKQVGVLEQGHGKLAGSLTEMKQAHTASTGQMKLMQQDLESAKGLLQKEAQLIQELRTTVGSLKTQVEQDAMDLKRALDDAQAEVRASQEDLRRQLQALQKRVNDLVVKVRRMTAAGDKKSGSSTAVPDSPKAVSDNGKKAVGPNQDGSSAAQGTPEGTEQPAADPGPPPLIGTPSEAGGKS